jgi:hypothetical protein
MVGNLPKSLPVKDEQGKVVGKLTNLGFDRSGAIYGKLDIPDQEEREKVFRQINLYGLSSVSCGDDR